jgi:membrane-associated phospholipid phosphatase
MKHAAVLTFLLFAGQARAAVTTPAPVPASPRPPKRPRGQRVPLHENFPWPEIAGIGALAVTNVILKTYEMDIAKARGEPLIGSPPGFDEAISNALYQGPFAHPFLLHTPELVMTEAGPVIYLAYRGIDSLAIWTRGRSLFGNENADHKAFAFAEAYTLTTVLSLTAKLSIGRERPFETLHRFGSDPGQPKTKISFWSNQTAASFCLATFVWRDFSDWLTAGPMADSTDAKRLWLGRVLPASLLGVAAGFDGYSRIVDQRHWFSDVVAGAVVGTVVGYGVYAYHFDWAGEPRSRWGQSTSIAIAPTPRGAALVGTF